MEIKREAYPAKQAAPGAIPGLGSLRPVLMSFTANGTGLGISTGGAKAA